LTDYLIYATLPSVTETNDPLLKLVSGDFRAEDREKLASLLQLYVVFDENLKEPHFREPFYILDSNADKLEVIFLAEKARSLLFENGENEGLRQSNLIALEIMPGGSVKSTLWKLVDDKQIRKNAQQLYYIPNYRLPQLFAKYLTKKENSDGK
jgi:hypothetical protein